MEQILSSETALVAKLEAGLVTAATDYCMKSGYQLILIPHLTKATGACENFSTLFRTDLFSQAAYLNQTGQLMLEAFMHVYRKTFCCGPSFRKELKADERHLIEFPLFEIEVADMDLLQLQGEISNIFGAMIDYVEQNCEEELNMLIESPDLDVLRPPYNSITYSNAIKLLSHHGLKFGDDLKAAHEQELVALNGGRPLFITHYPKEIKFFNMKVNRDDGSVVNSMDLLMPFSGEAVGAAEREESHGRLVERLESSDMLRLLKEAIKEEYGFSAFSDKELHSEALRRFDWYMKIIKEHPIPHAGCGIGISRVTQSILQQKDIRKSTAFPLNRATLF
ncbi:hypothetical protein JW968_00405 [Candidatus Woesearchaeota archaeon]|nr:hypothetical protein [Candidatus Woesearchaeota archaeon]